MRILIILLTILSLLPLSVSAITNEQLEVIKISENGGEAVLRLNSKKLHIVKNGQEIKGIGVIEEIFKDYIVIRSDKTNEQKKIIIYFTGGKQKIEIISKNSENEMVFMKSVCLPVKINPSGIEEVNNLLEK